MKTLTLLAVLCLAPSVAQAEPPQAVAPSSHLQELVRSQLQAFDRGDARAAWGIVSPGLRERFGGPDAFLEMVQLGYAPLVNSQRVIYGEQVQLPTGEVGQWLDVTGPAGERVRALYLFDLIDGSWQTTGCLLFEPEDLPPAA